MTFSNLRNHFWYLTGVPKEAEYLQPKKGFYCAPKKRKNGDVDKKMLPRPPSKNSDEERMGVDFV